jgi:ribosomal protein S18 acetylase RimI-like enzyme
MLTSAQVLERAYTDGYAELSLEMTQKKWNEYIKHSNHYIQQIAVAPEMRRSGVGQALVSACREMSPGGVAADILFAPTPFVNSASYKFFIQNGFRDAGSLEIKSLKGFQPCQTRIVFWGRG